LLPDDAVAVINLDEAYGPEMAGLAEARGLPVLRVGRGGAGPLPDLQIPDLQIKAIRPDATGQDLRLMWQGKAYQVRLSLTGSFQAENVALAAGLVIACGEKPDRVMEVLPGLKGVRGRMELAATRRNGAPVYVDYAHTPDAIATALQGLRPHVMGRLIVVFGAG